MKFFIFCVLLYNLIVLINARNVTYLTEDIQAESHFRLPCKKDSECKYSVVINLLINSNVVRQVSMVAHVT